MGVVTFFNGKDKRAKTGSYSIIANDPELRSGSSVLHEIFHTFGLSDRYTSNGTTTTGTKNGFPSNDIMAGGSQINQLHYNNWGAYILSQGSPKFTLNKFVDVSWLDGKTPVGTAIK